MNAKRLLAFHKAHVRKYKAAYKTAPPAERGRIAPFLNHHKAMVEKLSS